VLLVTLDASLRNSLASGSPLSFLRRRNNAQHSGQFRQAGPTRSHSHSSSVVRITGIGFGWIGATTSFGSVVRKP
jgi:hypothetical protein